MIRAYDPWPGTMTGVVKGGNDDGKPKVVKVLPPTETEKVERHAEAPGAVLRADKRGILIATGDCEYALLLKRVQPQSKKVMDASAYLAGRPFGESGRFE
ncbi:MAG: methionyl-tRNA formyltransferase [Verrucomicrobiales bacterium]|jgi:methionyl-tRNA formyltransferase